MNKRESRIRILDLQGPDFMGVNTIIVYTHFVLTIGGLVKKYIN